MKAKGAKQLADWLEANTQARAARAKENKAAEDEFVRLRDETTAGSEWARVGRLVDTSGLKKGKKDTTRLRTLLIQLKNPAAPKAQ